MKYLLFTGSILLLACNNNPGMGAIVIPAEHVVPKNDQQARRQRSEDICRSHHVPIYTNPTALYIDPEEKVLIRSKDEVVDRAFALCYIGMVGEGVEQKTLDEVSKKWNIRDKLTPKEKEFIQAQNRTQQEKVNAGWKYEDLHVLLWALGLIDSLDYPDHPFDGKDDFAAIHHMEDSSFLKKIQMRSKKEILDAADLILRLDWACVDARTKNQPAPGGLNTDVIMERHYVLNWLIRSLGQEWDDVSTDT